MSKNSQFSVRQEGVNVTPDNAPPPTNTNTPDLIPVTTDTSPKDNPVDLNTNTADNPIDLDKATVVNPVDKDVLPTPEEKKPEECVLCKAFVIAQLSMYGALAIALLAMAYKLTKTANLPKE